MEIEPLVGHLLDDQAEHVGCDRVFPSRPWLVGERYRGKTLDELGIGNVGVTTLNVGLLVRLLHLREGRRAAVSKARRVPEQIPHKDRSLGWSDDAART